MGYTDINRIVKRFKSKIKILESGCWAWQGSLDSHGYGAFTIRDKYLRAHRFSYAYYIGDIEANMVICHKCDNPICCSPFHLFKGTYKDNSQDAIAKGRWHNVNKPAKTPKPKTERKVYTHGTISMYIRKDCRCNECKEAMKAYRQKIKNKNHG